MSPEPSAELQLFAVDGGGRLVLRAGPATDGSVGMRARWEHDALRTTVYDRVDAARLHALWSDLGEAGPGAVDWHGERGRISLTLRWFTRDAGLRCELRPHDGARLEVETTVRIDRAGWRAALAAWLRELDSSGPDPFDH